MPPRSISAKQRQSLTQIIQILRARIQYNQELIKEVSAYDADETLAFFYSIGPLYRTLIDENIDRREWLDNKLSEVRSVFIESSIPSDINKLNKLIMLSETILSGNADLLSVILQAHISVEYEKTQNVIRHKNIQERKQFIADKINKSNNMSTVKKNQQQIKELIRQKQQEENQYATEELLAEEFVFGEALNKILLVSGSLENEVADYIQLHLTEFGYCCELTPKFATLCNKNASIAQELLNKCKQLGDAYASIAVEIKNNLAEIIAKSKKRQEWVTKTQPSLGDAIALDDFQRYIGSSYIDEYLVKTKLRDLQAEIDSYIAEEKQHKKEQEAQQQAAQKAENARKAAEKRAAELQTTINAKQIDELKKKKAQEQRAAALAEKQKIEQEEKERKEKEKLKNATRKQEIAANREKKLIDQRENLSKLQAATSTVPELETTTESFKLSDAVIEANLKDLEQLFQQKSIKFADAVVLIKKLGGEVVQNARGSSHHAIKFGGKLPFYLDDVPKASFTGGLPRPHKRGETSLYRFELKLLQSAIFEVLPEAWQAKFKTSDPNAKSKLLS